MKSLKSNTALLILLILVLLSLGATEKPSHPCRGKAMASPEDICPVLVGTKIPDVKLQDINGNTVDLMKITQAKPTVLIFYRGGWCPYCNTHLGQLKQIESQVLDLGYQIVAISPDRPSELKVSLDKIEMNYTLLSDSSADAAKAFGIAFKVDDNTLEKYKGYGIDLEKSSGQSHHILPVPAVFVIDTNGLINFQYVNPDYKTRLDPSVLLAAVKAASK
ncbi:MAG: peroxiredoxin-like family protein [Planctomycetota bacterium]|jgi:peroxiredoxin